MDTVTDKDLLVAEDEQGSFRMLYDRYWESLYKKALYRLGNDADAQDIIQEIFVSLWRNKSNIQIENSIAHYLFAALKYCIIRKCCERAKKGQHLPMSFSELENKEFSTIDLLEFKELQQLIDSEVTFLPGRMQEIYKLSRVENMSINDIALHLNLSRQTVKNTLTVALKRLRDKLSRHSAVFFLFL